MGSNMSNRALRNRAKEERELRLKAEKIRSEYFHKMMYAKREQEIAETNMNIAISELKTYKTTLWYRIGKTLRLCNDRTDNHKELPQPQKD